MGDLYKYLISIILISSSIFVLYANNYDENGGKYNLLDINNEVDLLTLIDKSGKDILYNDMKLQPVFIFTSTICPTTLFNLYEYKEIISESSDFSDPFIIVVHSDEEKARRFIEMSDFINKKNNSLIVYELGDNSQVYQNILLINNNKQVIYNEIVSVRITDRNAKKENLFSLN